MSKERLTVLLCGNIVGEMEKPLVIGKAVKPRCFKNLKINNLPVIWRNNKKAWMTAITMEEWLQMFNENRNAILFLNNATCHPKVTLSDTKNRLIPSKFSKWITAHRYRCYLHIQIELQTISDAIFDSKFGMSL
jgi:hypothetical protein